jgi:TM2 domain-containing membrane protein YozV
VEGPEENLRRRERALAPEARARYFAAWEKRVRDEDTYVVWAWALGGLGAHRFYLGQPRKALLHLCLFPAGVGLLVAGFAAGRSDLLLAGGLFVLLDGAYWVHDLVNFRTIVAERNFEIRGDLLAWHEKGEAGWQGNTR